MENTKKKENASLSSIEMLNEIKQLCNEKGWNLQEYSFEYNKDFECNFLTVKLW